MLHPVLEDLEAIKSKERVVEISRTADDNPEIIPILFEACKMSKPAKIDAKAAWVLHHIHNVHPQLIEPYVEEILDVLDNTDNHSVMREILKIVVEMKMPPYHKGILREPMFELGVGLLHDEGWQKGMYYIAMRLVSRFAETKDEKST